MASTNLTFASSEAHRAWLSTQAVMPAGFRVGTTRLQFVPAEVPKPAAMNLTLIALDEPTPDFAAVFTRNALPGAPVVRPEPFERAHPGRHRHQQQDLERART